MRRVYLPRQFGTGFYHCVSRVVDRRFVFGDREKRDFLLLMRIYEKLCQVRVLSYCLMDNHFHLLVEVPVKPEVMPTEAETLAIISNALGRQRAADMEFLWSSWRKMAAPGSNSGEARVQAALANWHRRMWDISEFMKAIKQRFTQWFNKRHQRTGTLWESRFKSTIIQGGGATGTVSGYIDLNPLRAEIVSDPSEYKWSSYGAAHAGDKKAQSGLERLMELSLGQPVCEKLRADGGKKALLLAYRERLLLWSVEQGQSSDGKPLRKGMSHARATSKLDALRPSEPATGRQGKPSLDQASLLQCRVRQFTAGVALGNSEFVEEVFGTIKERFGQQRRRGARRVRGTDQGAAIYALRDLGRPQSG
jgi:putative transposase